MRTILAIFARDVRRIVKSPVALVVTCGVALIPSLYAWCNILANWDPYANTGNIQVAVANEDLGTDSTLVGHLDAGAQTVRKLRTNHQLGWRFVSKSDALNGVKSGEYYAAIVLPDDFSATLIGSVTGTTKRPHITYYVNEKENAIAPKITDTGATEIDEQINSTFVTAVADAVATEVKRSAQATTQSLDGAQSDVIADLNTTIDQLNSVRDELTHMSTSLSDAEPPSPKRRIPTSRSVRTLPPPRVPPTPPSDCSPTHRPHHNDSRRHSPRRSITAVCNCPVCTSASTPLQVRSSAGSTPRKAP